MTISLFCSDLQDSKDMLVFILKIYVVGLVDFSIEISYLQINPIHFLT